MTAICDWKFLKRKTAVGRRPFDSLKEFKKYIFI